MSEAWELEATPWHAEVDDEDFSDDDLRPCGCPQEYHLADCSGNRAPTKSDVLEMYGHLDVDDWPDSED